MSFKLRFVIAGLLAPFVAVDAQKVALPTVAVWPFYVSPSVRIGGADAAAIQMGIAKRVVHVFDSSSAWITLDRSSDALVKAEVEKGQKGSITVASAKDPKTLSAQYIVTGTLTTAELVPQTIDGKRYYDARLSIDVVIRAVKGDATLYSTVVDVTSEQSTEDIQQAMKEMPKETAGKVISALIGGGSARRAAAPTQSDAAHASTPDLALTRAIRNAGRKLYDAAQEAAAKRSDSLEN